MVVNLTRYDMYSDFDETGCLQIDIRPVTEGEFVKFKDVEELLLKQSGEAPVQQRKGEICRCGSKKDWECIRNFVGWRNFNHCPECGGKLSPVT